MKRSDETPVICPVCAAPLDWNENGCRCVNGHSFDLAREGYVNLLLSHQRKSGHPGDDDAMIQARRRFFDSGAYDPVCRTVQNLILSLKSNAQNLNPFSILDCGCGEGRFLAALEGRRFGVDISKEAIRCAAKRFKDVRWIVANGMRALPFADSSLDLILSVLAPRNPNEFARILRPDGRLLLGVPGPNHLIELRSLLSSGASDFEEKADEAAAKCAPHFTETDRTLLTYPVILSPVQIADLIQMTPIFWCSSPEAKAAAQKLPQLPVTVSFALLTLKKSQTDRG